MCTNFHTAYGKICIDVHGREKGNVHGKEICGKSWCLEGYFRI